MELALLIVPDNSFPSVSPVEQDLDQIDFIDSCAAEEEEEEVRQAKCPEADSLSTQFMAYIEQRRISHEVRLLLELGRWVSGGGVSLHTCPTETPSALNSIPPT